MFRRSSSIRLTLAAVVATTAVMPAAFGICVVPGIDAHPRNVRAGQMTTIEVVGGTRHYSCNDTPGLPTPSPPPPVAVVLAMHRPGSRIELAQFNQSDFGHTVVVRIPRNTPIGNWTLRTSTGLESLEPLRVFAPRPELPRTGGRGTVALAAVGFWLVVCGAHILRRRPAG